MHRPQDPKAVGEDEAWCQRNHVNALEQLRYHVALLFGMVGCVGEEREGRFVGGHMILLNL